MVPQLLGFSTPSSPLPSPLSRAKGVSRIAPPPSIGFSSFSVVDCRAIGVCRVDLGSYLTGASRNSSETGVCRASQAVNFFSSTGSEVVVRDARIEDCWEVADTHCRSFFPNYIFPLDLVMRIDRFIGLLSGFSVPPGCMRACLVAVPGCANGNIYHGSDKYRVGDFEGKFWFGGGSVAGILTVDTVADFLPRKGTLKKRRTGIAYISNVAVRDTQRRKGIAKKLVAKAEARSRSWGCRAIALHCEVNNFAAAKLYESLGFKTISVPEHANWPQPKTAPDSQFIFMMKLLTSGSSQDRNH